MGTSVMTSASPPKFIRHSQDLLNQIYNSAPRRERTHSSAAASHSAHMQRTAAIYTADAIRLSPHDWTQYRRLYGLDNHTKIFICSNMYRFVREELLARGWHWNRKNDSSVFHARFKVKLDYSVKEGALYNF